MDLLHIPKDEYEKLADTFTAENFDARKIAALAKRAGMKYITLTTRHHDGFSLYDTCGLYRLRRSPLRRGTRPYKGIRRGMPCRGHPSDVLSHDP